MKAAARNRTALITRYCHGTPHNKQSDELVTAQKSESNQLGFDDEVGANVAALDGTDVMV